MKSKRRNLALAVTALIMALTLALSGCGKDEKQSAQKGQQQSNPPQIATTINAPAAVAEKATAQPDAQEKIEEPVKPAPVKHKEGIKTNCVMYFADGKGHAKKVNAQVDSADLTPKAMMERLLAGPDAAQKKEGFTTAIPAGTRLLGVEMDDTVCVVNLSSEFAKGDKATAKSRVAQVVFTLTQSDAIEAVQIKVDGKTPTSIAGEELRLAGPQSRAFWAAEVDK